MQQSQQQAETDDSVRRLKSREAAKRCRERKSEKLNTIYQKIETFEGRFQEMEGKMKHMLTTMSLLEKLQNFNFFAQHMATHQRPLLQAAYFPSVTSDPPTANEWTALETQPLIQSVEDADTMQTEDDDAAPGAAAGEGYENEFDDIFQSL